MQDSWSPSLVSDLTPFWKVLTCLVYLNICLPPRHQLSSSCNVLNLDSWKRLWLEVRSTCSIKVQKPQNFAKLVGSLQRISLGEDYAWLEKAQMLNHLLYIDRPRKYWRGWLIKFSQLCELAGWKCRFCLNSFLRSQIWYAKSPWPLTYRHPDETAIMPILSQEKILAGLLCIPCKSQNGILLQTHQHVIHLYTSWCCWMNSLMLQKSFKKILMDVPGHLMWSLHWHIVNG